MKPKDKFIKMYDELPAIARTKLIYGYPNDPMSVNIIYLEIENETNNKNK